jgi:hypothetical protein
LVIIIIITTVIFILFLSRCADQIQVLYFVFVNLKRHKYLTEDLRLVGRKLTTGGRRQSRGVLENVL